MHEQNRAKSFRKKTQFGPLWNSQTPNSHPKSGFFCFVVGDSSGRSHSRRRLPAFRPVSRTHAAYDAVLTAFIVFARNEIPEFVIAPLPFVI